MNKQVFTGSFIFISLGIILGFQNCAQNNLATTAVESSSTSAKTERLSSVDKSSIQSIAYDLSTSKSVQKVSSDGKSHLIDLTLDLKSGELLENDRAFNFDTRVWETSQKKYCVPKEVLSKIDQALQGASVCKRVVTVSKDSVCTMAVIPPYASLRSLNDQFALGGASDGCRNNEIDLCGEQSIKMRAISEEIKLNYQLYACQ